MLDALLPLTCPGCGRHGAGRGSPVCPACEPDLRAAVPAAPPAGVDAWFAPFAYAGVAREVVARVKYRGVRAAVPWLATKMVGVLGATGTIAVVTWAPTTPQRQRARGFDPAELLARAVARRLGLPAARLLSRAPGRPQTGLAAAARRRGPRFTARRGVAPAVLLVDDVATTGATLSAAAGALRAAGSHRIVAVTAARTPPPW